MNEKVNQYQTRLFNKLFATLPSIRKLKNPTNEFNLDEPITHIYSFSNKKFWFTKGENKAKFVYFFGLKEKPLKDITLNDATLIIDFDKKTQFNNNSLGLFSVSNSEIHILINYEILKKRYSYFNTGDFKLTTFRSIENSLNIQTIDLGSLTEDFIENLEKLIKLSSVLEIIDDDKEEVIDSKINEKNSSNNPELCSICLKDKNSFKINSNLNNLKDLKPELCGKCIEKILASEFYTKLTPLLKGNETKDLNIAKEKYGNDQTFEIGLKLLEKYDIIRYIGVKKLFFTLDKNSYLVKKYLKYSDKNNLLLDNISINDKSVQKNKFIDMDHTTLTRKTINQMNFFINALKSGKTHEEAYKIAKVSEKKVENWYKYGKLGKENYVPFYNNYKDLRPKYLERKEKMETFIDALKSGKSQDEACKLAEVSEKKVENWYKFGKTGDPNYIQFYNNYEKVRPNYHKRLEKMEIFLDSLKKDMNLDNALKKADLKIEKVRAWYNLGEKDDPDYKDFYLACKILLPGEIPKKETKKIVNNEELMNEFIALIEDGKTNEEAIEMLKIPKFKVKNWINQGKLGNKKYVDFYNAYMIQINKQKELKKSKKQEKELEKQKRIEEELEKQKQLEEEHKITAEKLTKIPPSNEKTCEICGRKLNKKSKNNICKRCSRKQYASKILIKLLGSIEPEKPFKKDDLKILGLEKIQITDYIWTLQEFNLIEQQNNTIKLKDREHLDNFIKDSGLEVEKIETISVKLNKTCNKCGETLEISKFFPSEASQDGFEDYCKDCKKLINTAGYLKEIIECVDYDSNFSEDDLRPYFKDSFKLQAKIWALLDNDLAKRNFEENNYILTDRKTAEEFLYKYYEQQDETPEEENAILKQPEEDSEKYSRVIIIKAMKEGKSRKEAAEIANVPLYKISHWYNEGRQGFGNENVDFYKQLKEIEKNNDENQKELKNRMELVLKELQAGIDIKYITNSSEAEINEWFEKGKENKSPYVEFYEGYGRIINNNQSLQNYNIKEINRKIFLENLKAGKSKEESAQNGDIELELLQEWYLKGRDGEEPYIEFYEKYNKVKDNLVKHNEIPQLKKSDKFGTYLSVTQMNIILESLAKGMDEKEAVEKADVSYDTYKYWINRGKQEFGELYTQFYHYVSEIKDGNYAIEEEIETEDNSKSPSNEIKHNIYDPLPEEYEDMFKSTKTNQTGIAWVNKIGNRWIYSRRIKGKQIEINDDDIYKLFEKVIDNNLVWGIRDYKKAKNIIDMPEEFINHEDKNTSNIIENSNDKIDPDIYAPLSKEYEQQFNPKQANKTGIAWVNQYGLKWVYSRIVNGKKLYFTDSDIYGLHRQVKNANEVWGIKDYEKAKNIIDIPKDKLPDNVEEPIEINKDIYAPLPEKYLSSFNPNQKNKTGIAWVNKTGHNWTYQRTVNKNPIKFSNPDITKLHELVIENGHVWGIIDYEKAIPIIETNTIGTDEIPAENEELTPTQITYHDNVNVTYMTKSENKIEVIIKGIIKNKELMKVLNRLELFEENIKRIITTSLNQNVDIFIELELNKYILKTFEEKIEDLNWNISK